MKKPFHNELVNAVKSNRLVIFAGAGVSYGLNNTQGDKIGGWDNMVDIISRELEATKNELLTISKKDQTPIEKLTILENIAEIDFHSINQKIKNYYQIDINSNLSLHKKIMDLTEKIITTNYDDAFELVNPNSLVHSLNDDLISKSLSSEQYIFKLHGSCNDKTGSLVLFPKDYDNLYLRQSQLSKQTMMFLHELILNNTMLFIGSGMGDFQINRIFKGLHGVLGNRKKHFIFTKKKFSGMDSFRLRYLKPLIIKDYSDIPNILELLIRLKSRKRKENNKKSRKEVAVELMFLGNRKLNNDNFEGAIEYYTKALQVLPRTHVLATYKLEAPLLNNIGIAKHEIGLRDNNMEMLKESIQTYQRSIKIFHDDDFVHQNLGNSYLEIAKINSDFELFEKAIYHFGYAIKINEKFDNAYFRLAECLYYYRISSKILFWDPHAEMDNFIEACKYNRENCERVTSFYLLNEEIGQALMFMNKILELKFIDLKGIKKNEDWNQLMKNEKFLAILRECEVALDNTR